MDDISGEWVESMEVASGLCVFIDNKLLFISKNCLCATSISSYSSSTGVPPALNYCL